MSDLIKTIDNVIQMLDAVHTELTLNLTDFNALPYNDWKALWCSMLESRKNLNSVKHDIERRDQAFEALKKFKDCPLGGNCSDLAPQTLLYCAMTLPACDVRHHLLVNYLASTWSVYDVIYDFATRMLGPGYLFENDKPGRNKKLSEVFDLEKNQKTAFVYGGVEKLFARYWAIYKVGYVFRNAFIHEGGRLNGKPILERVFKQDFFCINQDTKDFFKAAKVDGAAITSSVLLGTEVDGRDRLKLVTAASGSSTAYPWYDDDIRVILFHCNAKLDDLMAHMLVYAANSLRLHINQQFSTSMTVAEARIA